MNGEPVLVEDVDPAEEPVSIAEARSQCEADTYEDTDVDPIDDAKFSLWIAAARQHCEEFLGLSLGPKVFTFDQAAFPCAYGWPTYSPGGFPCYPYRHSGVPYFELPRGPVRWVEIEYGDATDALTLVQDIAFRIDRQNVPNRLTPIGSWPSIDGDEQPAVRIRYGAGYGIDSNASIPTPPAAKLAILGLVAYFYENRGNSTESALLELPKFVEALLRPLRVRLGMA